MADIQGVSLNQFILWALAEKVGDLRHSLDDPAHPRITYRRGASGQPTPLVRGTGIRVQTLVLAANKWGLSPTEIAREYGLRESEVKEALSFYADHRAEVDSSIRTEEAMVE
ncbi:MAG: DUF433 domain-containing protein [Chloroflexi bacterium]|nr:DUF433 domain-containing protein [Chloroflexota bacterium]